MTNRMVTIRELAGWGLDEYSYRAAHADLQDSIARASAAVEQRDAYSSQTAFLARETQSLQPLLAPLLDREDLRRELAHLDWTLGVVDLRKLLAFQRRLVLDPAIQEPATSPEPGGWPALLAAALGTERSTGHHAAAHRAASGGLSVCLTSSNPDLQVLQSEHYISNTFPIRLYGGSPLFEAAEYRGRWFLRDGYHRAYRLLQAGVHAMIAVVIHARTMEELGAVQPYFFTEDVVFSSRPPYVTDFRDDTVTITYPRPKLVKTIRIRVEESLEPAIGDTNAT